MILGAEHKDKPQFPTECFRSQSTIPSRISNQGKQDGQASTEEEKMNTYLQEAPFLFHILQILQVNDPEDRIK